MSEKVLSTDEQGPQYKHDCERCTFLGRHAGVFGDYDLYHCLEGGSPQHPTVVARYSSYGPDYKSGLSATVYDPELREALNRAKQKGLQV